MTIHNYVVYDCDLVDCGNIIYRMYLHGNS